MSLVLATTWDAASTRPPPPPPPGSYAEADTRFATASELTRGFPGWTYLSAVNRFWRVCGNSAYGTLSVVLVSAYGATLDTWGHVVHSFTIIDAVGIALRVQPRGADLPRLPQQRDRLGEHGAIVKRRRRHRPPRRSRLDRRPLKQREALVREGHTTGVEGQARALNAAAGHKVKQLHRGRWGWSGKRWRGVWSKKQGWKEGTCVARGTEPGSNGRCVGEAWQGRGPYGKTLLDIQLFWPRDPGKSRIRWP